MNDFLVHLHSSWRWLVLATALWAIVRAIKGTSGKLLYKAQDAKAGRLYVTSLHVQLLIGIVLIFVVDANMELVKQLFKDPKTIMKAPALRFSALEHPLGMIIAVVIATIGNAKVKRAPNDVAKHKKALIYFSISLLLILAMIPWPFMEKFALKGWF